MSDAANTSEQPRITVWWCDECGYWRQEQSTGVHVTYSARASKGERHPLRPVVFEMVKP